MEGIRRSARGGSDCGFTLARFPAHCRDPLGDDGNPAGGDHGGGGAPFDTTELAYTNLQPDVVKSTFILATQV